MTRRQRVRWTLLGVLVGVVITILAWVGLALFTANDVDADDAAKVAGQWAAEHRQARERYAGSDCGTDAGGYRFVCHVRFEPTERRFTLFMRKIAEGGDYAVVIAHVRKGKHPLPDFPNTVRVKQQ